MKIQTDTARREYINAETGQTIAWYQPHKRAERDGAQKRRYVKTGAIVVMTRHGAAPEIFWTHDEAKRFLCHLFEIQARDEARGIAL
jgi:hypothetical protein